jgi:rhodanese-related sulfurtransferase
LESSIPNHLAFYNTTDEIDALVAALHELVGTPSEFSSRRAVGARSIPLDTIEAYASSLPRESPLLLLCERGGRAVVAASKLHVLGIAKLRVIKGGTEVWIAKGLPVEGTDRKMIGTERQVRIGAGSLILLGVTLGSLVNPAFFTLSGFVGVGLVFAGITDWCGVAPLLAKAPWNR